MKITIHQPDFLPWFGFFYRWKHSDLLIIYDDAQYIKHGWQNRDKLLINEREQWLTVPVVTKGKLGQLVSNVMINNTTNWKHKHINTFKTCFGRTPSFSTVFPKIQDVYAKDYDKSFFTEEFEEQMKDLLFNTARKSSTEKTEKYVNELKMKGQYENTRQSRLESPDRDPMDLLIEKENGFSPLWLDS